MNIIGIIFIFLIGCLFIGPVVIALICSTGKYNEFQKRNPEIVKHEAEIEKNREAFIKGYKLDVEAANKKLGI